MGDILKMRYTLNGPYTHSGRQIKMGDVLKMRDTINGRCTQSGRHTKMGDIFIKPSYHF